MAVAPERAKASGTTMDAVSGEFQPQLDQAQRDLAGALDEVCSVDPEEVDTGELMRIEESLAVAMKAARQAVSLRLVRRKRRADAQASSTPVGDPQTGIVPHRVFDDFRGTRWHAFAVFPSEARESVALPATYRAGWLAFRSEHEIRRVVPIPRNWDELSIDELRDLCFKAAAVPKRGKSEEGGTIE